MRSVTSIIQFILLPFGVFNKLKFSHLSFDISLAEFIADRKCEISARNIYHIFHDIVVHFAAALIAQY